MIKAPRAAAVVAAAFCLCMAVFLLGDDDFDNFMPIPSTPRNLQAGLISFTRKSLLDSSSFESTAKKVWPNSERARRMISEATQFDPSTVKFPDSEYFAKKIFPGSANFGSSIASSRTSIVKVQLPETIDSLPQVLIDEVTDSDSDHFLSGCDATSAIRIDTSSNPWILTSLNTEGQIKTYGGDEFYITYSIDGLAPSPDAVARIVDRNDGTYSLYFLESRSPLRKHGKHGASAPFPDSIGTTNEFGVLSVNLISTCATSFLHPPGKAGWAADGSINVMWKKGGVMPPLYGYFNELPRQFPEIISKYDFVYAVGNSLMKNFAWRCYVLAKSCDHIAHEDLFRLEGRAGWRHNIAYSNGIGAPLNTRTVETHFLPTIVKGVEMQKKGEAKNHFAPIPEDRAAFILGSCVWDVASHHDMKTFNNTGTSSSRRFGFFELDDHLTAIRFYINEVRRLYPKRDIFWKGCTALHRHILSREWQSKIPQKGLESVFYTSTIRSRHLDAAQKQLMAELQIPVIDMFEISYEMAELHQPGDVMHYNVDMAQYWIDYFVPKK